MPCDSIQLNRVNLPKMRPELFASTDAMMRALGYRVDRLNAEAVRYETPDGDSVTLRFGRLEGEASERKLAIVRNQIAQSYSRATIYAQAQAQGWTVKQTGPNAYEVQR
jgi:hypothetical protein